MPRTAARRQGDWAEQRALRLGPDGWGVGSLRRGKRMRLERAWHCWLESHPTWAERPVELVYALVPLAPAAGPVRWIRQDR